MLLTLIMCKLKINHCELSLTESRNAAGALGGGVMQEMTEKELYEMEEGGAL